uniref:Putative secreted protein n=1 Tax=Anopheles darlingi TaxID=43151 RepID=A0A2M4D1C9_ANODA
MARDSQVVGAIIVIVFNVFVSCTASIKYSTASDNDRLKVKDTQTAGSNLWSPASEYYDDRNTGGLKKDFISSYEDKYQNNNQFGNKLRLGFCAPTDRYTLS